MRHEILEQSTPSIWYADGESGDCATRLGAPLANTASKTWFRGWPGTFTDEVTADSVTACEVAPASSLVEAADPHPVINTSATDK